MDPEAFDADLFFFTTHVPDRANAIRLFTLTLVVDTR
jgi:hypothetical protein